MNPAPTAWQCAIQRAKDDAVAVYKDACNHTQDAIEYMFAALNSNGCPSAEGAQQVSGDTAKLVRDIKAAIREISGAMTYPDLLDAIDQLAALTSPAKVGGAGLIEQHARDSAELRRLCAARDEARRTSEYWKAEHLAGNAEIKRLNMLLDAKVGRDEREASLGSEVRAFLENLAKANSEPLNSVAAYKDRASRVDCALYIRNHARTLLARAALSADGGDRKDAVKALAKSVFGGTNSLRWLLNITTEFDRQDVRTRQAARLLDEFFDKAGVTNRAHLEHLWKCLNDVLGTDEVIEILNERDAAIAAKAKGDA